MTVTPILQKVSRLKENAPSHEAKHLHSNLITLLTRERSNKMLPVVGSVLKRKPKRILDIGCGYGALTIFFAMQGIETVGIDLKSDALAAGGKLAETLGIKNVIFETMDACAISLSGFDMAISTDFYEHLTYEQQPMHLRSVWQTLKAGGTYIIRAPHRANIRQHREEHVGLPSFVGLRQQSEDAGFSVRFGIAHTVVTSPVNYHEPLERLFESRKWRDVAIYKALQKCGLANVIAHLQKVTARQDK